MRGLHVLDVQRADVLAQFFRELPGLVPIQPRSYDAELLSPVAKHIVSRAHCGEFERLRNLFQYAVTKQMAIVVVKHLEVVDVEHDDSQRQTTAFGSD